MIKRYICDASIVSKLIHNNILQEEKAIPSVFSHLKKRLRTEKKSQLPLPMPFELPLNYPLLVEEALEKKFLNGSAFTKFIMAVSSNIFYHKSHPTKAEYHHVIDQILKKYPFIVAENKKGSGDHYVSKLIHVVYFSSLKYRNS